jgi:hypothetical protein
MKHPKFIITKEGHFRLGMVNLHKHLLKRGDHCLGGGFYQFNYTANRILLDGESYDFGPPLWDMINILKVPSAYRGMQIIYQFRDKSQSNLIVTDSKEIIYV